MGRKFPPLDRGQVEKVLKKLSFSPKKRRGTSHVQWEGYTKGKRRIVTVDHLSSKKEKYGDKLLKTMIDQSGLSKKEFYSLLEK